MSQYNMRAFFAIKLPEDIKASLTAVRDRLRRSGAKASWVRPENMHLTLRFLGEVNQDGADRITEILRASLPPDAPVRLAVRGAGAFPNIQRPSVIWAGLDVLSGDLHAVQQQVEHAARAIGLPKDDKAFHPHITLARIKDSRQTGGLLDILAEAQHFLSDPQFVYVYTYQHVTSI